MVHFPGVQYRSHTSCISEDKKYQGALYKEKTRKPKNTKAADSQLNNLADTMSLQPYVEDAREDRAYEPWNGSPGPAEDAPSHAGALPEAPSPPAAVTEAHVNVFDFLVATGQTPNASNMSLALEQENLDVAGSTSLVRYQERVSEDYPTQDDLKTLHAAGPVPSNEAFITPGSKTERHRNRGSDPKKERKRKRLHVDVPGDEIMTDAPPVLHSGLTDGLKGLMRPVYPPSPDYSGGDAGDNSPASPLKKTKHSKRPRGEQVSHSLFDMITRGVIKSPKKSKKTSKMSKKHSHRHRENKDPKLIEFRPQSKDSKADSNGHLVVFKPRADAFLSFVNKGPESERGCSMNKALKRFHRERQASGSSLPRSTEEKELWRTLRMRRNERGEIILFTV